MVTGNLAEIFLSLQGEGTSLIFLKPQVFIRFGGCNLAQSAYGTNGCKWCDTSIGKYPSMSCLIEEKAASGEFKEIFNPVSLKDVSNKIIQLGNCVISPSSFFGEKKPHDVISEVVQELNLQLPRNSLNKLIPVIQNRLNNLEPVGISITGGEPLHQFNFLQNLSKLFRNDFSLHLETNASIPSYAEDCATLFHTCCADIKDRTAGAAVSWKELVNSELKFIQSFLESGNNHIFAKIVVTNQTQIDDLKWIAKEIEPYGIDLVIQPVTPVDQNVEAPNLVQLERIEDQLLDILDKKLWINMQTHKLALQLR